MAYKKLVLPSAREEFDWFCGTYGPGARADARRWIDAIARAAETGVRKLLYVSSLDDALGAIQIYQVSLSPRTGHGKA